MAVTGATFSRGGWTGSVDEKLNTTFSLSYNATTDDINDGPKTVLEYFDSEESLPFIADRYNIGTDVDIYAYCNSVNAKPYKENPKLWTVSVGFKLPDSRDAQNAAEANPLYRRDEVSVSFSTVTKTPTHGYYKSLYPIGAEPPFGWRQGDFMPLMTLGRNPSPVPEAMLPEVLRGDQIVTITRYLSFYNADFFRQYVLRAVNSDVRTFNDPTYKYVDTWNPREALLTNASGNLQYENGVSFWKVTMSIHLKRETWDSVIPNKNYYRSGALGDPDGQGSVISEDQLVLFGNHANSHITDRNGHPVAEPVWLDERGQPLGPREGKGLDRERQENTPHQLDYIHLRYNCYEELPYGALGLGAPGQ